MFLNVEKKILKNSKKMADISFHFEFFFWHERAAFQRSVFGRLTAGNGVVATFLISLFFSVFLFFFFSAVTFSHRKSAQIKKLI